MVDYPGLARRLLLTLGFLMRPQLNGGTSGGGMRSQAEQHVGVTGEQIRSEQQASIKRSRASGRLLARPVNFAANLLTVAWTILKAVVRP